MALYHAIPSKGDHVEQRRLGIRRLGVVWYSDQLQVLVKWEDGTSSSLRLGRDQFSIRSAEEDVGSVKGSTAVFGPRERFRVRARRGTEKQHSGKGQTEPRTFRQAESAAVRMTERTRSERVGAESGSSR